MTVDWYDRDGKPLADPKVVERLICDFEYKRVALDQIGQYSVSTVWLGLDHNHGVGPPLIFETMVFDSDDAECFDYTRRYPNEIAALAGHDQMVAQVKEATA